LNVSLVFHFEGETVDSATFTQVQTTPMVRYDADELTAQEREKLVGRYYSRELELWLDIRAEDEGLVIHRLRGGSRKLTFRSDLTFTGPTPFGEVEFQRAANGEITGLVVGNGRTKGVLFVRQ
jgi:hypothetical protein